MKFSISKLVVFTVVISAILIKVTDKNFGKNGNYGAVDWDNFGYYLYLPATFIYDDLKLQNDNLVTELQEKYDLSSSYYQAHSIHNGNRIIQYTSGIAIIYCKLNIQRKYILIGSANITKPNVIKLTNLVGP